MPNPAATHPESGRPRSCLDEPLSPLVLSYFHLACRSQRHPCPQAQRHVPDPRPTNRSPFERCSGLRPLQLAPSSLSPCLWLCVPGVTFSSAPVSLSASRTRQGLTTRHFPHWPRRTPHLLTGLCPSGVPDDLAWRSAQTRGK